MNDLSITRDNADLREVSHMRSSRLDDSLFSKELAPHYIDLSKKLAASELVPKCYRNKPSDLFLCWAKGYQLGISPEQAMDCISVINGKAVMWGDEMLALCMAHPDFVDITEVPMVMSAGNVTGYTCTIMRKNRSDTVSVFTLDMAKKAGLIAKGGVWNQYPERMLKLRARGFALRDAFPDALKGIKPREEVEDYIEAEYRVVEVKNSRTETLKHDYLTKTGANDVDEIKMAENQLDNEATSQDTQSEEVVQAGEEALDLIAEVTRLIGEKGLSDERLSKALAYYEVDCVESLSHDQALHFRNKLTKL